MKRWPDGTGRQRAFALAGAGVAFSLAFVLLWSAGLPDPARLLAVDLSGEGEAPIAPVVGARAPSFTVTSAEGDLLDLGELRGAPVVLNFWATWCAPCEAELPGLQAVYEESRAEGLRILAVNAGEPVEVFAPWAAARGLTFDLVPDVEGRLAVLYQIRGLPQTVVIGPDGVIGDIFYGAITAGDLEVALQSLHTSDPQN